MHIFTVSPFGPPEPQLLPPSAISYLITVTLLAELWVVENTEPQ